MLEDIKNRFKCYIIAELMLITLLTIFTYQIYIQFSWVLTVFAFFTLISIIFIIPFWIMDYKTKKQIEERLKNNIWK